MKMSIASLEKKLNKLQGKNKKLKSRKASVEIIVKKLNRKPADDVEDIKKSGRKTADLLEKAVEGVGHIANVADDIRVSAMSGHSLDEWEEKEWLNKEILRLKEEIKQVERDIQRVKAELQAAREAAREAALQKLRGLV